MNTYNLYKQKKAISPIIATLLLILIAIAAGVIVYAYVVGFIGNSTTNSGASTNTLSVDQLAFNHASSSLPVTVYVRNLGPSTESFNTGFYVKGSSVNDQIGPAVTLACSTGVQCTGGSAATFTIPATGLQLAGTGTNSITVTVSSTGLSCLNTGLLTVSVFGTAVATLVSCVSGAPTNNSPLTITLPTGITTSSVLAASTGTITAITTSGTTPITMGTSVSGGTLSVAINTVVQLTLAPQGTQVSGVPGTGQYNNPLSVGQSYTVQVTGNDGGSTSASAKAA